MRRFADSKFKATYDQKEQASRESQRFLVEAIRDYEIDSEGKILFLVKWQGFSEDTRELANELFEDVPDIVLKYLRGLKDKEPIIQRFYNTCAQNRAKTLSKRRNKNSG